MKNVLCTLIPCAAIVASCSSIQSVDQFSIITTEAKDNYSFFVKTESESIMPKIIINSKNELFIRNVKINSCAEIIFPIDRNYLSDAMGYQSIKISHNPNCSSNGLYEVNFEIINSKGEKISIESFSYSLKKIGIRYIVDGI